MTTGWRRRLATPSAAARAIRALAPPGANVTTHLIGRSGQTASAGRTAARKGSAARNAARRRVMVSPKQQSSIIGVDAPYAAWQHSTQVTTEFSREMNRLFI